MKRRIFSISIVLGFLLLASVIVAQAKVLELTATPTPGANFVGAPISGAAPLAVQFTDTSNVPVTSCTWMFGDGTGLAVDPTGTPFPACPSFNHTYTSAGSYSVTLTIAKASGGSVSLTRTNYIQVGGPVSTLTPTPTSGQPDLLFPVSASWIWDPNAYDSVNGCYNYTPVLVWNVQVKNAGSADAGSFVVNQNYDRQKTVSGLPAGQTSTLYFPFPGQPVATAAAGQPTLSSFYSNFLADYNNQVSESNETNNTTRSAIPVFTPTLASGATRVYCKTPTPGTPVATFTPTRTLTRTPTITATGTGRSPTPPPPSHTPTASPTSGGLCSPVTSTITAPFTWDGAGTYCWQSSNLGSYINNWNNASVMLNSLNITNLYVPASSYPAKIGGFWYVSYNSSVAWGHFEAK
jgi:PKD repeat protein